LKDFIEEKRLQNRKYSYSYYSHLIQSSEPYLKQVLAGRRSLSLEKATILATKLKLETLERSFFLTLIMLNEAESKDLKSYFNDVLERILELRPLHYQDKTKYSSIFHNTLMWEIYTLLGTQGSSIDEVWIQKRLKSEVKLTVIRKHLKYLLDNKFIDMIDGKVKTHNIVLQHDTDLRGIYANSAKRAIDYLNSKDQQEENEYFDSFCLILDENTFPRIKRVLEEAKAKISHVVSASSKTRTAFFNINLFFSSKKSS
jgi:uncharacterized protein (TIGR02147 family)